ncbi:enoyl-CoA hydratase/isomerase family protein [Streptomyces griseorubiginosus]|uniref:enoyl-CoA hydratase/isomerase family protein n=1 Tax=Streptomyces griseorubiginosus TaxID=67304 RepID=UPI0036A9CEA9
MSVVRLQRSGPVARIVLNRPDRKNALDTTAWALLQEAVSAVAADEDVRVLILTGAGDDFSAGADIGGGDDGPSHRTQLERMQWFNEIVLAVHRLRIPTIAQVDGLAVGIGMNIALACDFVVASDRARFSEIFVKRALSVDGGGSWLLPRLVGIRRAKALCLLGDLIPATEAMTMGLVTEVVPAAELPKAVDDLAARLATRSRPALAHTKRLLDEGLSLTLEQALENEARAQAINVAGEDFSAAMQQFRRAARDRATGEKETGHG